MIIEQPSKKDLIARFGDKKAKPFEKKMTAEELIEKVISLSGEPSSPRANRYDQWADFLAKRLNQVKGLSKWIAQNGGTYAETLVSRIHFNGGFSRGEFEFVKSVMRVEIAHPNKWHDSFFRTPAGRRMEAGASKYVKQFKLDGNVVEIYWK